MLTFEQIKELIELVGRHRLSGVELERADFRLKVDGETQLVASAPSVVATLPADVQAAPATVAAAAAPPAAPAPAPAAPAPAAAPEESEAKEDGDGVPDDAHIVTSPIVGTFYRSPNPDSPPFAEEGATVEDGQVLCIVEAMKLMNEIESDASGVVVKIFPSNGQAVEYGEPLFAIRTS